VPHNFCVATRTYVFPDTNYFLHWPPFEHADWKLLAQADEVVIIVASVVFYEIEKHKDKNSKGGVRKRALQVTTRLEAIGAEQEAGAEIADGVRIRVLFDSAPPEGYASEVLAKEVADDRIVVAMVKLRESMAGEKIVVMTGDRALRMKSRAHGFKAVEPPADQKIGDEEEETEVETLRRELEAERGRRPKPRIEFDTGGYRIEWPSRALELLEDDFVSNRLEALKKSCPKREQAVSFARSFPGESFEEVAEFNAKLDTYYLKAEAYLHEAFRHAAHMYRAPILNLQLTNDGNAAATHLRVVLKLKEGLRFWHRDDGYFEKAPPRTPSAPGARMIRGHIHRDEFQVPDPDGDEGQKFVVSADGSSAAFELPTLVHHAPEKLPRLIIVSEEQLPILHFHVDWTLSCAELPSPVKGQLHITKGAEEDYSNSARFGKMITRRYRTELETLKKLNPELWD
jgi:hypothetical protein